jgi:ETFB lysine methyltransferase
LRPACLLGHKRRMNSLREDTPPAELPTETDPNPFDRVEVPLGGRNWLLDRTAELEQLWDAMGEGDMGEDERLPYWTEVWPAGVVLANWLRRNPERIANRVCLDMGCGLGLASLVAREAGAKVIGMDYEELALLFASHNTELNQVDGPGANLWTLMDWRKPGLKSGRVQVLWGGDILYEHRFLEPVTSFLDFAAAKDGVVWLADPGRPFFQEFLKRMAALGWQSDTVCTETAAPPAVPSLSATIRIWEFQRNGASE